MLLVYYVLWFIIGIGLLKDVMGCGNMVIRCVASLWGMFVVSEGIMLGEMFAGFGVKEIGVNMMCDVGVVVGNFCRK